MIFANLPAPPMPSAFVTPLTLSEKEMRGFSLLRALDAARTESWLYAPFEREVSREAAKRAGAIDPDIRSIYLPAQLLQRRDLTAASASGGGHLVGTQVLGVIDAVREQLATARLGVGTITGLRPNVTFARQGAKSTVSWLPTEGTQATETETYQLGQLSLTPKSAVAYCEVSRQLRTMAPDLAETMVLNDLRRTIRAAIDAAAFAGTGSSGQPTGLVNVAGIGTFTGASVNYAGILEAQRDVLSANALTEGGTVGFTCRPTVAELLANRQGFSTLVPMWQGPLDAGQLAGCKAVSSMSVPASTLVAGDWQQMVLAEWGAGLVIDINPYANFPAGIFGFRAVLSMDVCLLQPSAFSVATSVS